MLETRAKLGTHQKRGQGQPVRFRRSHPTKKQRQLWLLPMKPCAPAASSSRLAVKSELVVGEAKRLTVAHALAERHCATLGGYFEANCACSLFISKGWLEKP
jgi:hypothetical protein